MVLIARDICIIASRAQDGNAGLHEGQVWTAQIEGVFALAST